MRASARKLCRAGQRAVTVRPDASSAPAAAAAGGRVAVARRGALGLTAEAISNDLGAARQRVFAGSSDGTSYSVDSPILGAALRDTPHGAPAPGASARSTVVEMRMPAASSAAAPAPAPERAKDLSELQQLPAAELRRMLAIRGVSMGSVTEKAELAKWVHQHQDLPVVRRDARACEASRGAPAPAQGGAGGPKSVAELRQMSVAELREELQDRGVGEGPATEKSELVEWVWQHQHLPVLRQDDQRRQQRARRGARRFGGYGESDPYDLPRDEQRRKEEPRHPQLEGSEAKQLEGDGGAKLLEGGAAEDEASAGRWSLWWIPAGLALALAAAAAALAANDARRAAEVDASTQPLQVVGSVGGDSTPERRESS